MSGTDAVLWAAIVFDLLVSGRALVMLGLGRMENYRASGWFAVGDGPLVIGGVVAQAPVFVTAFVAAVFAYNLHAWWKGGGGDDTKRRLRKLGRSFTGTRRTAPAAG